MIKSMTGYGRGEAIVNEQIATVEIKSVNHRFLDLNIKFPRNLAFVENIVRTIIKEKINRGKIDIFINYKNNKEGDFKLSYNEKLARQYYECFYEISKEFNIQNDVTTSKIAGFSDVLSMEDTLGNQEEIISVVKLALDNALNQFLCQRNQEGENLKKDLIEKCDYLSLLVDKVQDIEPIIIANYREKITEKVKEFLDNSQIDESRIVAEVILFADKVCNDEETVRLKSHIQVMKDNLSLDEPVGRKLDFIAQEMNREANTILSKSNDIETSNIAIEMKTHIEKIREQIQNIE